MSTDGKWIVQHEGFERHVSTPRMELSNPGSGGLDFTRLLQSLVHWRWLILSCLAAGVILGVVAAMMTTPMYRASVTLEVNPLTVEVVDEKNRPQSGIMGSEDLIATQVGLLTSRSTAEHAAQELNLANNSKVVGTVGSATERLRRATDVVAGGIKVKPPISGTLIEYSYASPSPELAAAIANQIANSFINSGMQRRYDASSYARTFLSEQIAKSRADLEQSERKLVEYAQAQGIINTAGPTEAGRSGGDVNSLQGESLVELNRALGEATARRVMAEGTYRQGVAVGTTSDVTNSTAGLRAARATLQAEYQEKRMLMKPDHPDMVSIQSRIAEIDKQIVRESSQVSSSRANSLMADFRAAAAAESALRSKVDGLKGSVLNLRGRSIQYNILQRETDTNRSLYDA
ncbi:Wzz/FepE/Etk N-terminal domain-containing protein, partial [Sphingomonas sp.]|uniref:GumC family protein n=1 Tax=Sphingomonas sp. TaxID=28214 RepID=UPI00286CE93F